MNTTHLSYNPLQSLPFSSISGTYAQLGVTNCAVVILKFTNTTDADIIISIDGVNAYDFLEAGSDPNDPDSKGASYAVYDLGANIPQSKQAFFSPGVVFIKSASTDPTKGAFYMTIIKRFT